ncbi:MAG TPA: acyl carrier protein [Bacteroidales bacterium]|nr:acyl carrier protein [Bacteroidales bacterium]HPS26998.1 acyl carrier protein [Bacteroidales bacterium]
MNTFEELNAIFCKTFYDDDIVLTREHTVNDIEGWDSLSHTSLVFAVEKHFGIKFDNQEIPKWKNVGEMYDRLLELLQKK